MRESGQSKSRLAESFRRIGESLLKVFRGDFTVFLLFLAITFFFWWSRTMSQNWQTVIKIPVQVTSIPQNVRVTVEPLSQISVLISGKGSALRKSTHLGREGVLNVSNSRFAMINGHASLYTLSLADSLEALLPSQVVVNSIEPDSLSYRYVLQRTVMLPVEFDGTLESQNQYFMENIRFTPDSVVAKVLLSDTAHHRALARMDNVTLTSQTTEMEVPLSPIPGVLFNVDKVQMTIEAQQYTEKSIEVPVTGINFPDGVMLKAFPSKATITIWVPMSDYEIVGSSDFKVVVDYNDIQNNSGSRAPVHIFSQPANVLNVRLQTHTVDYLIETRFAE